MRFKVCKVKTDWPEEGQSVFTLHTDCDKLIVTISLIVTFSLTVWECGSDINLRLATRTPKEKKAVLSWQEDPTYREINA